MLPTMRTSDWKWLLAHIALLTRNNARFFHALDLLAIHATHPPCMSTPGAPCANTLHLPGNSHVCQACYRPSYFGFCCPVLLLLRILSSSYLIADSSFISASPVSSLVLASLSSSSLCWTMTLSHLHIASLRHDQTIISSKSQTVSCLVACVFIFRIAALSPLVDVVPTCTVSLRSLPILILSWLSFLLSLSLSQLTDFFLWGFSGTMSVQWERLFVSWWWCFI